MSEHKTSVRQLLERPSASFTPAKRMSETEPETDYSAYGHGRISRHAQTSLMLCRASGAVTAIAYSYFYSAESDDPGMGFVLNFVQHKIAITGRNLETLFRLLCQQRVVEIREAARSQLFELPSDAPIVESIVIQLAAG